MPVFFGVSLLIMCFLSLHECLTRGSVMDDSSMQIDVHGNRIYVYTGARTFDPACRSVVFVHGSANDHSVWALQSRYFAHHGWNALAPDLPGHGKSGGSALASVAALADWVIDLLDAAGVDRASLVGHSLGALMVLEAAARYPDRCEKIALLGPAVPMSVSDALLDCAKRDDHLAYELINGWSHSAGSQLGSNPQPGVWITGNAMRLMERTTPGVLYTDLAACHAYADGLQAAQRVRNPALLLLGERDIMAPRKNATVLAQTLRDSRVVTLPDCGHSMMSEQPDAVLDALRDFF